jgi:hypothetical protein
MPDYDKSLEEELDEAVRDFIRTEGANLPSSFLVCRLNFFVELPFDIGMPNNSTMCFQGDPFPGLEEIEFSAAPGAPVRRGLNQLTSFLFRRVELQFEPLEGMMRVFPELPRDMGLPKMESSVTAVSMSRITYFPTSWDTQSEQQRTDWFDAQFEDCFEKMNLYLTTLGIASSDAYCGPISRLDLPAVIPYVFSSIVENSSNSSNPIRGAYTLHGQVPFRRGTIPREVVDRAHKILGERVAGRHIFFDPGIFMLSARRSLADGLYEQAIVQAQTCIEMIINVIIREVAPLRGKAPQKVKDILTASFRNRVVDHIGKLTGVTVDLKDISTPVGNWWDKTYLMRNRVVHEGYRPTASDANSAVMAARRLQRELGEALNKDPLTAKVGSYLYSKTP